MKKTIYVLLGIIHLILLLVFVSGPELAPLLVYIIDFPVYFLLNSFIGLNDGISVWSSIIISSILYPAILYWIVVGLKRISKKSI